RTRTQADLTWVPALLGARAQKGLKWPYMSVSQNLLSIGGSITNALVSLIQQRSVDAEEVVPVGWHRHQQGVETLTQSFAAVPAGQRVRLAKKTSNLFCGRTGESEGLDVCSFYEVINGYPWVRPARVYSMCNYED